MKPGWPTTFFGALTLAYGVEELAAEWSRLSAVLWMPPIGRVFGRSRREALAWGDLVMMRKQLTTLADLAEQDQSQDRA